MMASNPFAPGRPGQAQTPATDVSGGPWDTGWAWYDGTPENRARAVATQQDRPRQVGAGNASGASAVGSTPTSPDPFVANGGGFWTGTGWVPKDHPLATGAGAGTGTGTGTSTSTSLTIPTTNAPGFTAPTLAAPGVASPTLGTVQPYTGPSDFTYGQFQVPGAEGMFADPGYQYRLDQGVKALDASAAARGTLRGGAQMEALTKLGQDHGSQEYQNVFNRAKDVYGLNYGVARDVYDRGYTAAGDVYDRNRLERDATYDAGVGAYNRDRDERTSQFDAAFRGRAAEYAPSLASWEASEAARRSEATGNFDRGWDRERYTGDDAYRRWRDEQDNSYRWGTWRGDDDYRRMVFDDDRLRYLTDQGNR